MSDRLGRRLLTASGALAVLVALIFAAMLVSIRDLRDSGRREHHAQQIIAASNAMQTLVLSLETSQRGYVITQKEPFLGPWKHDVAAFPARASALEQLAGSSPRELRSVSAIVANVHTYIRVYSRPLVRVARHDPVRARAIVSDGGGKRRIDTVRRQFGSLIATETATADRLHARASASGRNALAAGVAGILGSALLILAFAAYLARAVFRPMRRMATATEHQKSVLEHRIDVNRALLDASVDGIRLVDLAGRTLLSNSVIDHLWTDVFRLEKGGTLQDGAAIVGRLTDPKPYLASMQAIAGDPGCTTHDELELADVRRAFQRHTGPVHDAAGELIGRIIVLRETTVEHEAARLKAELVATVSHELRTPLSSVLGFAELLVSRSLDADTSRRYAQAIHGDAQRLAGLVDDFLDVQRIETGRFTLALEPFGLSHLLASEVEAFSARSPFHTLALAAPDGPLALVGDRPRVGQVIANLLSNAIKYSPAGSTVTVTAVQREGFARVLVSDCGVGIPAEQQAQVFTRFFRVDSSDTREIGGTGLGLALCHEIVGAHGGRMGFDSNEGAGSTFWFELPIPTAAGDGRAGARAPVTGGRHSVLVVDDDAALRRLVIEALAGDGDELREAADGVEALAMISDRRPDVLVLDLLMPNLDGFGLLERAETRLLPIVVLTGRELSPGERQLLRDRKAWLLEKGRYSGEELRGLVREAIGHGEETLAASS